MRQLYCIGMLHTAQEIGSEKKVKLIQFAFENKFGKEKGKSEFDNFFQKIEIFWGNLEKQLRDSTPIFNSQPHVFVDGLPRNFSKDEIINAFKNIDSPMAKIILELIKSKAQVHGTEKIEDIIKEKNIHKKVSEGKIQDTDSGKIIEINKIRNISIANFINETINENETGVLFLGFRHFKGKDSIIRFLKKHKIKIIPILDFKTDKDLMKRLEIAAKSLTPELIKKMVEA